MKKGIWFFLLFLLISALIGSAIGEIIALLLGPNSPGYHLFTAATNPSVGPIEIDLILIKLTLGAAIHVNLMALLAMVAAIVYYLRTTS